MKTGVHIVLGAAAKFYTPLIVLFALSMLALRAPGDGVGFLAGMAVSLALVLHILLFGAAAARKAFPSSWARLFLALGLIAALVGAGAPGLRYAAQTVEAGLFAITVSGAALILAVIFGRAPTMRDEQW
jgi:multicomponent Na+:H+ antiporter subunit B